MPSVHRLIEELLLVLKETPGVLATAEDAAYFLSLHAKRAPSMSPQQQAPQKKGPEVELPKRLAADTKPVVRKEIAVEVVERKEEKLEIKLAPPKTDVATANSVDPAPSWQSDKGKLKSTLNQLLAKIAPELAILDAIPSDAVAKKIASRWKTKNQSAPISVICSNQLPQHQTFLEEIALALDVYFGPARIVKGESIEKEKQWESFLSSEPLKLIVICDATLWQLENLRKFYKENPSLGTRTLGSKAVCLLPDLSLYFKDPLLKRSLWKALHAGASKCL